MHGRGEFGSSATTQRHLLQAFVLTTASQAEVTAATGGGVSPLVPSSPFALAEAVAGGPDARPVLIVGARHDERLVRTYATYAVARWPELPVAWRAVPAAALAAAHAAATAARADLPATLAVSYFDLVLEHTWSGAWIQSVAGLGDPSPSLAQHARSWFPGAGFYVLYGKGGQVLSARALGKASVAVERRGELLVGGVASAEVIAQVMAVAGTSVHRIVAPVVDPRRHYGSARAVEFVGAGIAPDLHSMRLTGDCPSCGSPLATDACPFCHVANGFGAVRWAS